jgi:Holliday junction DNA helicase RuvA
MYAADRVSARHRLEKHPDQVIVDAGGVGYDVTIPISTYSALPAEGAEVRLRIHSRL